jgi:hypothetical protein
MQDILPSDKAKNFSNLALLAKPNYRNAFQNRLQAKIRRYREKERPFSPMVAGNGILVYPYQGQNVTVTVGTLSWYAWLETVTTFRFVCDEGTFTAQKMRAGSRRGGWYWRAYRYQRGQTFRYYLGVSTNLTLPRLRETAHLLAIRAEDAQEQGSQTTIAA